VFRGDAMVGAPGQEFPHLLQLEGFDIVLVAMTWPSQLSSPIAYTYASLAPSSVTITLACSAGGQVGAGGGEAEAGFGFSVAVAVAVDLDAAAGQGG
jgi:hypothetical protein